MAGGTYNPNVGKDRPGTYINFKSTRPPITPRQRGIELIPLINHDYGPAGEFITIPATAPDSMAAKLGYSVYDNHPNMLLIYEGFKGAAEIMVYIPTQGERAKIINDGLTATARYGGARGNDLRFSITPNPVYGFDVAIYLDEIEQSLYEGLATIEQLIEQNDTWIEFVGEGDLKEVAGANLAGGTSGTTTNSDLSKFLDASEGPTWHTMAFPVQAENYGDTETKAVIEAAIAKSKTLRDGSGKYRQIVVANHGRANYPGIINVTNSVAVNITPKAGADPIRRDLSMAEVTAWVAGQTAGATDTESLTYAEYEGAIDIIGDKGNEEAIDALKNGEFFFSWSEERKVIVESDINSLVTFEDPYDKSYRKNRVIRVYDALGDNIKKNFPPNKYDNNDDGWDAAEGEGKALLLATEGRGAIKNVDTSTDFLVDRSRSSDDEMYFNVGVQAVDSGEKLYFTIGTR